MTWERKNENYNVKTIWINDQRSDWYLEHKQFCFILFWKPSMIRSYFFSDFDLYFKQWQTFCILLKVLKIRYFIESILLKSIHPNRKCEPTPCWWPLDYLIHQMVASMRSTIKAILLRMINTKCLLSIRSPVSHCIHNYYWQISQSGIFNTLDVFVGCVRGMRHLSSYHTINSMKRERMQLKSYIRITMQL